MCILAKILPFSFVQKVPCQSINQSTDQSINTEPLLSQLHICCWNMSEEHVTLQLNSHSYQFISMPNRWGHRQCVLSCLRAVVSNLGPPDVLGLHLPEAFTTTSSDQDFWELKSKNIWRPKVGDHCLRGHGLNPSPKDVIDCHNNIDNTVLRKV